MSVVAAKVLEDRIEIAADSIVVRGWNKRNNFLKLREINSMIIGGCGSAQELALMYRYAQTHRIETPTERDVLAFISEFSNWKKEQFNDASVTNEYLIAFDGHLFNVYNMYAEEINDYYAIGAGMYYAQAALYLGHSPKKAVKVACELCAMVSEPVIEFTQKRKG